MGARSTRRRTIDDRGYLIEFVPQLGYEWRVKLPSGATVSGVRQTAFFAKESCRRVFRSMGKSFPKGLEYGAR